MDRGKEHLETNGANASPGIDAISQKDVLAIPSEELARLFNYCLQNNEIPRAWLLSLLAAVPKKNKDLSTPENYRIVGLQSCLMKLLTLIIDFRVTEWIDDANILPRSQNGFRRGNRTHNNSFILRTAIDHAHAHGRVLYVAFVDLENAFPSTDLSTLWTKWRRLGVGGPMYDWIRRMYRDMEYVVKVGKSCSDTFTSSIGVLAGDCLSPTLWNIYFSDFTVPEHPDDVIWEGIHISHVEHADDIALMSFSPEGLQHALDHLNVWCRKNFMSISVPKSHLWTSLALIPESVPRVMVADQALSYVTEYNFVGIRFDSASPYIYDKHYRVKATQARLSKDAIFSRVENRVGSLPVKEGLVLYTAKVDPYLIAGCEIVLDIDPCVSEELRQVSLTFLRHLLSVHPKTGVVLLHAETGEFLPNVLVRALIK